MPWQPMRSNLLGQSSSEWRLESDAMAILEAESSTLIRVTTVIESKVLAPFEIITPIWPTETDIMAAFGLVRGLLWSTQRLDAML